MIHSTLKNKYPFVTDFFEKALFDNASKLYQAYLLTGSDSLGQYLLAMNVAQILNCSNNAQNTDCGCVNCRWIKENKHPAVITVSPIDFTGDDGRKTVISVNQARNIKKFLSTSSPYHRVIIFADAQDDNINETEYSELYSPYQSIQMQPPHVSSDDDTRKWIPKPLNERVFQEEAANALLKTIEEPPPKTTFFFLSNDKTDVISTIVSRCQVLNLSSNDLKLHNTEILTEFISKFPPKNEKTAIYLSENFMEIAQNNSLTPEKLLEILQEYLRKLTESNIDNKFIVNSIIENISTIEDAKTRIKSHINPKYVVDSLFLQLLKKH